MPVSGQKNVKGSNKGMTLDFPVEKKVLRDGVINKQPEILVTNVYNVVNKTLHNGELFKTISKEDVTKDFLLSGKSFVNI